MMGISVALGGGVVIYCGTLVRKWGLKAASDAKMMESQSDWNETPSSARQAAERGALQFGVVCGRLGTFDSQVLMSKVGVPCVRINHSSEAEYERWHRDLTSGKWSSKVTRELLTSADLGGSVAIEPFTSGMGRVVLRHEALLEGLWVKDDETFTPSAPATNVAFFGGNEHADKMLGVRSTERVIQVGKPVSCCGLVESQLIVGSEGPPQYGWVLLAKSDPRVTHSGFPTLVVPGTKADLVQAQQSSANTLDMMGWGLGVLGAAIVVGGLYQAECDLTKQRKGNK